jgi:hypothetical protein
MAQAEASARPPAAHRRAGTLIVGGALVVSLIVFAAPTAMLLMAGLCPTLASAVADNGPGKRRSHAIGVMNLAGLTPWLVKLWSQGGTFEAARPILADPIAWLCIYGAAAGALMLLWIGPWAAAGALILSRRRMAAHLDHEQRTLEKEWGQEVVRPDPPAH